MASDLGNGTHRFRSAGLAALALGLLAFIAACGINSTAVPAPPATDTPAPAEATSGGDAACPPSVVLPDNAEAFLKRNSRIQVIKIADAAFGASADEVTLFNGEIVVNSLLAAEKWVEVTTPYGFIARLAGRTMMVAYEGAGGQFTLACVDGACKLGPDAGRLTDVPANSQGSLDKDGNFLGPFAISLEGLPAKCETIFTTTPLPTRTSTATPPVLVDFGATATAACQAFLEQFPLTPTCP